METLSLDIFSYNLPDIYIYQTKTQLHKSYIHLTTCYFCEFVFKKSVCLVCYVY